jgi:hypothetical protein
MWAYLAVLLSAATIVLGVTAGISAPVSTLSFGLFMMAAAVCQAASIEAAILHTRMACGK